MNDLDMVLEVARAGAAVVRQGFETRPAVRMKGAVDPVTLTDEAAEAAIFAAIERLAPGESVLGEESGGSGWDSERVWIVDPLDGTVNFVHGLPHFSVSVAVWERGEPVAGAVVDVMRGEEFTARRSHGTRLDGRSVTVAAPASLQESLVVTGFPYDRQEHAAAYAATVGRVLERVQGIRRLGSAALDLAWVACGRYDGYWEYGLGPWDAAAGMLLVEEAGGRVTDLSGDRYRLDAGTIVAAPEPIHYELQDLVARHLPPHLR